MVTAQDFLKALTDHGHTLVTGVPCSYFSGPLRLLERGAEPRYIPAVNEGSALAIAAGAWLGGGSAVVMAQNSGFGNLVNPLTSLVMPYRIPVTVFMSMRGWPRADAGEPQHEWMGRLVPNWLDSLGIAHWWLTAKNPDLVGVLGQAQPVLADGRPVFVLVGKGAVGDDPAAGAPAPAADVRPTRDDVVATVVAEAGDARLFSTTGYLSRSLFHRGDTARNFYMQGSMGHVSALALGAALESPENRFVVLDGDGAALMHMGVMATIGASTPANLTHVVFDNGIYESTGGQRTDSATVDLAAVALACGYRAASTVDSVAALREALRAALAAPGQSVVVVRGATGGSAGERASGSVAVGEIGARFRDALTVTGSAAGTAATT